MILNPNFWIITNIFYCMKNISPKCLKILLYVKDFIIAMKIYDWLFHFVTGFLRHSLEALYFFYKLENFLRILLKTFNIFLENILIVAWFSVNIFAFYTDVIYLIILILAKICRNKCIFYNLRLKNLEIAFIKIYL